MTGSRMWRCAGLGFALEDFDDDHIAATARADEPRLLGGALVDSVLSASLGVR